MNESERDFVYTAHKIAADWGSTEMAVFDVDRAKELTLLQHIRPGQSTQEVRDQAIEAFRDIVTICVSESKDGALEVGDSKPDLGNQFCIVYLSRNFLKENEATRAAAFIVRCPDQDAACRLLDQIRCDFEKAGYAPRWQLYSERPPNPRRDTSTIDEREFSSNWIRIVSIFVGIILAGWQGSLGLPLVEGFELSQSKQVYLFESLMTFYGATYTVARLMTGSDSESKFFLKRHFMFLNSIGAVLLLLIGLQRFQVEAMQRPSLLVGLALSGWIIFDVFSEFRRDQRRSSSIGTA